MSGYNCHDLNHQKHTELALNEFKARSKRGEHLYCHGFQEEATYCSDELKRGLRYVRKCMCLFLFHWDCRREFCASCSTETFYSNK